jgi:ATP-dependent DNA helicase RecG
MTIEQLKLLKESEDRVEFKEAKRNFPFNGGSHADPGERRKCVLGYVAALANEGGGLLVLGMTNTWPHEVVGSEFGLGKIGEMEDAIYQHHRMRVHISELFEGDRRVVVFKLNPRPIGKTLKFEGVALMRTGDSLRPMSDDELLSVLSEQEPDFSAKICRGLTISDLDLEAVERMKAAYAKKQKNPAFATLSLEQILSDLGLSNTQGLTYAALILLGKVEAIGQHLPQSRIIREFRNEDTQIHHDSRDVFEGPLYKVIDLVWAAINDPRLNRKTPVQFGSYIFDIFSLNESVIREALLNAVAHRDYTIQSEVVVKQYPERIVINNPGGFPKGVTLENLLTVSSTPRSRLMTEVMEKTGLVERSGQGVDKIFSITLSEGKAEPDYSASDSFQVTLSLSCTVIDKAFHVFINRYQLSDKEPKLGVEQIITLCKIRNSMFQSLKQPIVDQLLAIGMVTKPHHSAKRYQLHDEYYQMVNDGLRIGKRYITYEIEPIIVALQDGEKKIGELAPVMEAVLSRSQLRSVLQRLIEDRVVTSSGRLKGTRYALSPTLANLRGIALVNEAFAQLRAAHE